MSRIKVKTLHSKSVQKGRVMKASIISETMRLRQSQPGMPYGGLEDLNGCDVSQTGPDLVAVGGHLGFWYYPLGSAVITD